MPAQIKAIVEYEDPYVEPLILSALRRCLPPEVLEVVSGILGESPLLQWRSYETLDFEHAVQSSPTQLMNAFVIRKALIRKHYLSYTVHSWVAKHPDSALTKHFKPAVDFELDYAEFLDDALVEAFELREAFEKNTECSPSQREWWILKPGMSDRGQGIRLFSTEGELQAIFEGWDADEPSSGDDEDEQNDQAAESKGASLTEGIVTSHLRHFVAQPYIHPPLLCPHAPYSNRKFHIRTYVVASGALSVYVYTHMLALFASSAYAPPWETMPSEVTGESSDDVDETELLERMRNVHLSNTCVQTSSPAQKAESVFLFEDVPFLASDKSNIVRQIHDTTAELFRAALAQPTNFQPLPQAFEIFGLDFMVSADPINAWLLEVNAFPDFAQTGDLLKDKVVSGLFEDVVKCVVCPRFGVGPEGAAEGNERLVKVMGAATGFT